MSKKPLEKILDFAILGLAIVYFVGFLSFYPDSVFLKEAPYKIPREYETHFEYVLWVFFSLLILDLYLKYKKMNSWNLFLKRHWHEIVMLVLIPFLAIFKIAKVAIKLVKTLKASKSGFKVFYKAKKASKHMG